MLGVDAEDLSRTDLEERKTKRVRKDFVLRNYEKGTFSFTLDASSECRASVVSRPTSRQILCRSLQLVLLAIRTKRNVILKPINRNMDVVAFIFYQHDPKHMGARPCFQESHRITSLPLYTFIVTKCMM